jgi:hypothetical protein
MRCFIPRTAVVFRMKISSASPTVSCGNRWWQVTVKVKGQILPWAYRFRLDGPYIVGRTPIGRVTVYVLNMNHPLRVELRRQLLEEGKFPTPEGKGQ